MAKFLRNFIFVLFSNLVFMCKSIQARIDADLIKDHIHNNTDEDYDLVFNSFFSFSYSYNTGSFFIIFWVTLKKWSCILTKNNKKWWKILTSFMTDKFELILANDITRQYLNQILAVWTKYLAEKEMEKEK